MPALDRPLTRRTALALGAAGAATLTACDALSTPGRDPDQPDPDPDVALVDETVSQITATAAVAARVPSLTAMHTAHLAALDAATPTPSASSTSAPGTAAQVRAAERALHGYLVSAAMRARSGELARLLASMSASVSQHLVALPRSAA